MNKLFISPAAEKDLLGIKRYIAEELSNSISANKVVTNILRQIKDLVIFPEKGVLLSSKINIQNSYRFIICGNYLTFYRYENNAVYVDRIIYGKRDYIRILFGILDNDQG